MYQSVPGPLVVRILPCGYNDVFWEKRFQKQLPKFNYREGITESWQNLLQHSLGDGHMSRNVLLDAGNSSKMMITMQTRHRELLKPGFQKLHRQSIILEKGSLKVGKNLSQYSLGDSHMSRNVL
jgi:hypothetical protein